MALAIGEHYSVSVLVHGSAADKLVSGRLYATDLEEAIESLSFLVGTRWRLQGSGVYLIGGSPEKTMRSYPSYGLQREEMAPLLRDGGSVLADRVVVETDQLRASQIGNVLAELNDRHSLDLELYVLSVAESSVDRVNEWLDTFQVGLNYFQNSALPYVSPLSAAGAAGAQLGEMTRKRGFTYRVDARALLDFVKLSDGIKVETRQTIQVLSGGRSRFSSGDVLEDVTYTTVPGSIGSDQLVSNIQRRTVGLVFELSATYWGTNWSIKVLMEDSSLSGGNERTTSYTGERILRPGDEYFLLASFTRDATENWKKGIPVLNRVPLIGKVFRKEETVKGKRSVMVVARPVHWAPAFTGMSVQDLPKK